MEEVEALLKDEKGNVLIRFSGQTRIAGKIDGKEFITNRKKNHYFRKHKGFGISEKLLNRLIKLGINTIHLYYEVDEKKHLVVECSKWKLKGIPFRADEFENQLILGEIEFEEIKK